jgi:hypothetical protein
MTRPTITQTPGVWPRASLEDDDTSDQLVTMTNEHANAIDTLEASGGSLHYISPVSYGAVGDGVHDDASAIQSAITAAGAGDLPLYFPPGTYKIGTTLTISTSNFQIYGANKAPVILFDSTARDALKLVTGISHIEIHNVTFQGDSSDDKDVNAYAAIQMSNGGGLTTDLGITDVSVHHCIFDHCTPLESDDSFHSARLHFYRNLVKNVPNGIHPPSDSTIEDCDFIADAFVATRSEYIYQYGQQCNLAVRNCRFKNGGAGPDIQIRSTGPRFLQRFNFRVEGCHFEATRGYCIWVGSDDHPDITDVVITGNTFRNCIGPVNLRGGGVVTGNNMMWDWENPNTLVPGSGQAIGVLGGQGASGAQSGVNGAVVSNNRFIHRHPWVGKVNIDTVPSDGDTVTVGAFTYTWKNSASSAGQVTIGVDVNHCAANLVSALKGEDGLMTAPNNVLRNVTDVFYNALATVNSENNGGLVVITSWNTFSLSKSSSHITITAAVDMRDACTFGVNVANVISPLIEGNVAEEFPTCVAVSQSVGPTVRNNTNTCGLQGGVRTVQAVANVMSAYSGNRIICLYPMEDLGDGYTIVSDAFPVFEDYHPRGPQLAVPSLLGRSGIQPVGDGYAYGYFYFGAELANAVQPYTRPWRWDDGDQVVIQAQTLTFKRSSPGANEFNDVNSFIAAINGGGYMTAATAALTNDYGATDPKVLVKLTAAGSGAAYNAYSFWTIRYKKPGDTVTYVTVPQPLINGTILRNRFAKHEAAFLYGGADTLIKTFVFTPIACPTLGVMVQGADSTSRALNPYVDQADIIPGVGFYITHDAAAGTESFYWRVG